MASSCLLPFVINIFRDEIVKLCLLFFHLGLPSQDNHNDHIDFNDRLAVISMFLFVGGGNCYFKTRPEIEVLLESKYTK